MKKEKALSTVAKVLVLSGTVLNYAIFTLLFVFFKERYNLQLILYHIDTISGELIDYIYSTLLFISACVWILIAARAKARAALAFSAVTMFLTSVIALGAGLFQPMFDVLFGWLDISYLLVCLFDKAAHIYLGCISIKYFKALSPKEDEAKKPLRYRFIVIPLAVSLIIAGSLIVPNIPPLFKDTKTVETEVDEKRLGEAVQKYEEIDRENLYIYIENNKLEGKESGGYNFGEYRVVWFAYKNGILSKEYHSSSPRSFEPFNIEKLSVGEGREEFFEKMPLQCAGKSEFFFYSDGTTGEVITYACSKDRCYYDYRFVFTDGKLAYGSCVTREDTLIYRIDDIFETFPEMPIIDKKEIGDTKFG